MSHSQEGSRERVNGGVCPRQTAPVSRAAPQTEPDGTAAQGRRGGGHRPAPFSDGFGHGGWEEARSRPIGFNEAFTSSQRFSAFREREVLACHGY